MLRLSFEAFHIICRRSSSSGSVLPTTAAQHFASIRIGPKGKKDINQILQLLRFLVAQQWNMFELDVELLFGKKMVKFNSSTRSSPWPKRERKTFVSFALKISISSVFVQSNQFKYLPTIYINRKINLSKLQRQFRTEAPESNFVCSNG